MRRFAAITIALFAALATSPVGAATTDWVGDTHAAVRLVTASDAVGGQSRLSAGLEFRFAKGWHGYWRKPGDAGVAPVIKWDGSVNAGQPVVLWPAPARFVIEGLQNNIYEGDVTLPVDVSPPRADAAVRLKASVDYAACSEICVPFHAALDLGLPAGLAVPSAEASAIDAARETVPKMPDAAGIIVAGTTVTGPDSAPVLTVDLTSKAAPFAHPDLFVEGAGYADPGAPRVTLGNAGRDARLVVTLPEPLPAGSMLTLTVVDGARRVEFHANPRGFDAAGTADLLAILLTALIGGLILNLMPCVLPVLSIKLLGVVRHAGMGRRATRAGLTATALGIVASFAAIGLVLIVVKLSGATVGWGIQFQQPWFLGGMALVTTLFAASLFEWLPVHLPGAIGSLGTVQPRGPLVEAFVTGAFATLLATPCSAPFVGTAVGFALAKGPREIMAVFVMLGIGMALPYLIVAAVPGLVRWMPRPGAWMIRLRQVLGLFLIGTAAWLLFVLASVAGLTAAAIVGAILLALLGQLAWSHRTDPFRTLTTSRRATGALAVAALAAAILAPDAVATSRAADGWHVFDPDAVQALVADGKTVLVDVTASWCLTCKANELTTFDRPAVRERLDRPDVVRMRADWSRPDPTIAAFLKRFDRYGIPLDVVFSPAHPTGAPLPELLTPSLVFDALDGASTADARG